jgi:hypothetical protein
MTLKDVDSQAKTLKNRRKKMFEENKEPVTDVTENVEETTEQTEGVEEVVETPKTYTEDELNARVDELLAKKIARKEAKIRKEYEEKYSSYKEAETVLNAGLGTSNITEATENLREFYTKKGINIPKYEPTYNNYDMEAGAEKEANSIIKLGYDEVVEEVDRLANKGELSPRDKLIFNKLANYRKAEKNRKELAKIGVKDDVISSSEFKEFAKDFKEDVPITKIYERFEKTQPKPKVETIGSMKNATSKDSGVKDFYTRDEALKFTKKDFDKNPALFKAVENSMLKW